jgi:DNA-binding NarL/FixJ family response regulator
MRVEPLRVFVVDDHQIVREGLRAVLEEEADLLVVGEAGSGDEALQRAPGLAPAVVLIDLVMPGMPALEAIRQLRATLPGARWSC